MASYTQDHIYRLASITGIKLRKTTVKSGQTVLMHEVGNRVFVE